jgi:hypothetical protein
MDIKERFLSKIEKKENGCWIWKGAINRKGYGIFRVCNKNMLAHRASYWLFKKDIEPGKFICHICDVRSCVNPDHLFSGTQKENMEDAKNKGRIATGDRLNHHSLIGELSNWSRITEKQVRDVINMYLGGEKSLVAISKVTGVKRTNVWQIIRKKNWKHIWKEIEHHGKEE